MLSCLSKENPAHRQRIGPSASFYNIEKQMCSTCLWHSQYKPQVAIPPVEVNRHAQGTDKQAEEQWPNHRDVARCLNFATGALPCQPACICEVSVQQGRLGGGRRCASVRVPGRLHAVRSGKSLLRVSRIVVFYHFLKLTNPSSSLGFSV